MENRATRIFKLAIALIVILVLGIIGGLLTAVEAAEAPTDLMSVKLERGRTYTFSPDGYSKDGYNEASHTGSYLIYGEADRDIRFASNNGEPVTYNVIFHNLDANAWEWYGIFGVDKGVTLNITVYGTNNLVGYNHPGITVGKSYDGANAPVVNFTIGENSRIKLGYQYSGTSGCVADGVEVNVTGQDPSIDLSDISWRANREVVFYNGTGDGHALDAVYVDEEYCKNVCDTCDLIKDDFLRHNSICKALPSEDPDYSKKHTVKCEYCSTAFETVEHGIRFITYESEHYSVCLDCEYATEQESHSFENGTCVVCGISYIAKHTDGDGNETYVAKLATLAELVRNGGTVVFLNSPEASYEECFCVEEGTLTIDLAGVQIEGVDLEVRSGAKITIIDSSKEKTGDWSCASWQSSVVDGGILEIDGITIIYLNIIAYQSGSIILKNVVCTENLSISVYEESRVEITEMSCSGELKLLYENADLLSIRINSGSFAKIVNASYFDDEVSVNQFLPSGYAYVGENGLLDGSKSEISGVTSIVEHAEHNTDLKFYDDAAHWTGCSCCYCSDNVEKFYHTVDESGNCPECQAKIVALVRGAEEIYFTTLKGAFEWASTLSEVEIALMDNVTDGDFRVQSGNVIKLDLNGYTAKLYNGRIYVHGKLTICDGSQGKTGLIEASSEYSYIVQMMDGGELIINSGNFSGLIYSGISSSQSASIVVNGGKFIGGEKFRLQSGTSVEINGGTFECGIAVFDYSWSNDIELTINGGVFKNSTVFYTYDKAILPLLSDVLGISGECQLVFLAEDGTELTMDELSDIYDGTIVVVHKGATLKNDGNNHWYECEVCDSDQVYLLEHTAKYEALADDAARHSIECVFCAQDMGTGEHSGGEASCTDYAECEYCQAPYGEAPKGHTYDNDCDTECNECQSKRETTHTYGTDGKCTACKELDPAYKPSEDNGEKNNEGDNKASNEAGNGLGAGAIIGIVSGAVVLLLGLGVIVFWLISKRRLHIE